MDEVFRAMDLSGDGKISKEEMKDGYLNFYGKELSDKEIDEMFDRVDADGNGEIDYSEFVIASMNDENLLTEEKLRMAFKRFDKDGGGTLSHDEIK